MNTLMNIFRKIPLIGKLLDVGIPNLWNSTIEVGSNLFWSTMPIWLGTLVLLFSSKVHQGMPVLSILVETIHNGELFMYSTAVLAPIVYMALNEKKSSQSFPYKLSHMTLVMVITVICAVLFGLGRANQIIDNDLSFKFSIWLYGISVMLLFIATTYNNSRLDPRKMHRDQEQSYVEEYIAHRRG